MGDNVIGWQPVSTAKAIKVNFTTSDTIEKLVEAYVTAHNSRPRRVEVTDTTTGESYDLSIRAMALKDASGTRHNIGGVILRSRLGRVTSTTHQGWRLEGFIDFLHGTGWFKMEK